jgi:hypothetical protein
VEPVTDGWAARQLKQQGREILVQSLLAALALTALALLVPSAVA